MRLLSMTTCLSLVLTALTLSAAPALAADPFTSDWVASAKSRARLIADGEGGAGVEIQLAPGAITYWRDPGDSGLPPSLDFGASRNVHKVEAEFPAPIRIAEPDGSVAIGYRDAVILPIRVSPNLFSEPITLNLTINYAVCEKICLPARASLKLELPSGISDAHYESALAAARLRVPSRVTPDKLGTELLTTEADAWRVCFAADPAGPREAFVEPPSGYELTTKAEGPSGGRECYGIKLNQASEPAPGPIPIRVTLVGSERPVETTLALEAKK
jgi:DsbC/DsbD-like thiol-disulfide interchange protein